MNSKRLVTITTCLLMIAAIPSSAQKTNRGSNHFFITGSLDYHINNWDVNNTDPVDGYAPGDAPIQDGWLKIRNNVGARLGVQYMRTGRHKFFWNAGFDFKVVPQSVHLSYKANENGFAGSNYEYNKDYSFTNFSVDFKGNFGYSFSIVPHKTRLDLGIGFVFDIPMNGQDNNSGQAVYADAANTGNQDLILIEQVGWGNRKYEGNTDKNTPLNFLGDLQIVYRFLPGSLFNDRGFKIGLEFNTCIAGSYNNNIYITGYSANRSAHATQAFKDDMTSASLLLGIEL